MLECCAIYSTLMTFPGEIIIDCRTYGDQYINQYRISAEYARGPDLNCKFPEQILNYIVNSLECGDFESLATTDFAVYSLH